MPSDAQTHHLDKPVMIGRITEDGWIAPVLVTEAEGPIPALRAPAVHGRAAIAQGRAVPHVPFDPN